MQTYAFGDSMPESAMDVAVRASNLAPQVMSTVVPTAYMLMQRQRFDEAIVLLPRMAYGPHSGSGAAEAQRLLRAAIRHELPSASAEDQPPAPSSAQ